MLFNLPPELPPPPAKAIARQMLERANDDLARMIADHKDSFNAFWSNPHATPAEILEHMGPYAGAALQLAWTRAQFILAIKPNAMSEAEYMPPVPLTFHNDGTVTL